MPRSLKKGPYIDMKLLKKVREAIAQSSRKIIKTWARSSMILPEMVGLTIGIHNGREFLPVLITESIVGHKLGEFSPTRLYKGHSADKKTKKGK